MFKGIAASPGIAIGKVLKYENRLSLFNEKIQPREIDDELKNLHRAVQEHILRLTELRDKTRREIGEKEAEIFDAHILMLKDPMFIGSIEGKIRGDRNSAAAAVKLAAEETAGILKEVDDEYIRERADDIEDVGNGLIRGILNIDDGLIEKLNDEVILVAQELNPSDTARMDKKKVLGFALDTGGRTSHVAIMANSMEIPAVLGVEGLYKNVNNNDMIIVDGNKGIIIVNPSDEQIGEYNRQLEAYKIEKNTVEKECSRPCTTRDGKEIEIGANIGTPGDAEYAKKYGARGVGLYRTEFLFMDRDDLPSEEEQFAAYREVAEKMAPGPVIIRTLDIGADKSLPYLELPGEQNPFLGWRAIRICLDRRDIFDTQLRAILRASNFGNIRIMYPMICEVRELVRANGILQQIKDDLKKEGVAYDEKIETGIMIETPAAAIICDILVKYVDFFSIGTNDLTQYTLAVDRMNNRVADLYNPMHPAVLRLVKYVIDVSHRAGKWTGMCGELAGEMLAAPVLVGLGIDEMSMSSSSIPRVKAALRRISFDEAQEFGKKVLSMEHPEEIQDACRAFLDSTEK